MQELCRKICESAKGHNQRQLGRWWRLQKSIGRLVASLDRPMCAPANDRIVAANSDTSSLSPSGVRSNVSPRHHIVLSIDWDY